MNDTWNGVPQHPERDGWHWLQDYEASFCTPVEWRHPGGWVANNIPMLPHEVQKFVIDCCEYLGPCLTPAEVVAREAAIIEDENRNPWKMAVINAMVCWETLPHENETPREALNRLLTFEQMVAIDPAVSSAAAEQINAAYKRGQEDMRERAAQEVECGCDNAWKVVCHHPSSAARWNLCGRNPCGAISAMSIRELPIKEANDE